MEGVEPDCGGAYMDEADWRSEFTQPKHGAISFI